MSRYMEQPSGYCPDDAAREREANIPREIDPESDKPRYEHRPVTWEQLQAAIRGELREKP